MPGWESGLPGAPTFSFLEGKGEVYHTDYTNIVWMAIAWMSPSFQEALMQQGAVLW